MTKYKSLLSPLSMMHSHRYYMHLHAHIRGVQNLQDLTKTATLTNYMFMVFKSDKDSLFNLRNLLFVALIVICL